MLWRTIETKHSLPIRPRVAQIHTHSHHIRTFAFQCKSIFAEIRGDSHHIRKFTPHSHDGHTTFAWVHTGSHEFTYVNIREVLISIVIKNNPGYGLNSRVQAARRRRESANGRGSLGTESGPSPECAGRCSCRQTYGGARVAGPSTLARDGRRPPPRDATDAPCAVRTHGRAHARACTFIVLSFFRKTKS